MSISIGGGFGMIGMMKPRRPMQSLGERAQGTVFNPDLLENGAGA